MLQVFTNRHLKGSVKEPNSSIYFFFPPITQWWSVSGVLFTGGRGVSHFSVLKYYWININYSVNILSEWMSTYSNRLQPALQNLQLYVVRLFCPRKSLVKPVTQQKTCNYNVVQLFHRRLSCTTHILADVQQPSADICVVDDDLGRKNWTTHYNCRFSVASLALRVIFSLS